MAGIRIGGGDLEESGNFPIASGLALLRNPQGCHRGFSVIFFFLSGFSFFFRAFLRFLQDTSSSFQKIVNFDGIALKLEKRSKSLVNVFKSGMTHR